MHVYDKGTAATDDKYGSYPDKRSVEELLNHGVVNLDKPGGPTSHQVAAWIKNMLGVKTGHGGTLDPAVTGVLPIFLGKATRLAGTLLLSDKEYIALMHLHEKVSKRKIEETFNDMQGEIEQLPPVRSAVKRVLRKRTVYNIDLLEIQDRDVLFRIRCEAGTYIRKYCHDFGEKIGCGSHMVELRRIKSGFFLDENLITLQELKDAYVFWKAGEEKYIRRCVLPMELAIGEVPQIWVRDSAIDALCHGSDLAVPGVVRYNEFKKDALLSLLSLKGELVAMGNALMDHAELKRSKKGLVVKVDKVFMEPDTYLKSWKEGEPKNE